MLRELIKEDQPMRLLITVTLICTYLWIGLAGSAAALSISPEPISFQFDANNNKAVSGSISLGAGGTALDLRLALDSFKLKSVVVRVTDPSLAVKSPESAFGLEGPGVNIKKFRVNDESVDIRFRNFRSSDHLLSDSFSIEYAEALEAGDRIFLTLTKGKRSQTVTALITPEPSTAVLLLLGLGLFPAALRFRSA